MTAAPPPLLEVVVTSPEGAQAAQQGGAARVELCSDLAVGGVTPDAELITRVRAAVNVGLQVMIRPRGGDFCYTADELAAMEQQIATARRLGADGVVLGALCPDGTVDVAATSRLIRCARPLAVTFHRAFDAARDLPAALEAVIATGAARILTSGGAATAEQGRPQLARLVRAAAGRITVLAGGRIRAHNVRALVEATGVREVHAALEGVAAVRDLVSALRAIGPGGPAGPPGLATPPDR